MSDIFKFFHFKWDLKSIEFVNFIFVCWISVPWLNQRLTGAPTDSQAELLKMHLRTQRSVHGHAQSNERRLCFWLLYRFFKMADCNLSKLLEGMEFPQTSWNIFIAGLDFQRLWLVTDIQKVCLLWFQKWRRICVRTLKSFCIKLNRYIYKGCLLFGYLLLAPPPFPKLAHMLTSVKILKSPFS